MGEALLGGALAGVVFFGIRWLRGFSQRMNEHPAEMTQPRAWILRLPWFVFP